MTQYKIERWDVVMFGTSITKVPMIYVKPDISLLEFFKANDYAVVVNISGTGTGYDGKQIVGVVDKSGSVPNCRPNFFEETGYYVITLNAQWQEYPPNLGTVSFSGLKPVKDTFIQNIDIERSRRKRWMILAFVVFALAIIFFG